MVKGDWDIRKVAHCIKENTGFLDVKPLEDNFTSHTQPPIIIIMPVKEGPENLNLRRLKTSQVASRDCIVDCTRSFAQAEDGRNSGPRASSA